MNCPKCHSENPDDAINCLSCGAVISHTSPQDEPPLGGKDKKPEIQPQHEDATSAELTAQAEILAQKIRERRAQAARTRATTTSSISTAPVDQEPKRRSKIEDVESAMNVVIGLILVSVVFISGLMSYLNIPGHKGISASIDKSQKNPIAVAKAEPSTNRPVPDNHQVSSTQDVKTDPSPSISPAAAARDAEPVRKLKASVKEGPEPATPDSFTAPVASVTKKAINQAPLQSQHKEEQSLAGAEQVTTPADEPKTERAMKVAVVDKSIVSNVTRKREVTGCNLDGNSSTVCATKYVVSFKRFWGPMLEERIYSSRGMSIRAQELWSRESKILEPDGSINEAYVVKPKTFAPIPGFPIS